MSRNAATHSNASAAGSTAHEQSASDLAGQPPVSGSRLSRKSKGLVNNEFCYYCEEGGQLLNCDRCPASFHLMCHEPPLDLEQVPKGEFLCNKCRANAALHHAASVAPQPAGAANEIILLERQLLALPVTHETKTVEFELFEQESSLNTLIRMAKSLNPRQMQLSKSITHECAFDLPGLSKLKWWKKEGNRIVNAAAVAKATDGAAVAAENSLIMDRLNAGTADPPCPAEQAGTGSVATAASASAPSVAMETSVSGNTVAASRSKTNGSRSTHSSDTARICFICQK